MSTPIPASGGVESMAKELGLLHLDVYTPSGLQQRFSFSISGGLKR